MATRAGKLYRDTTPAELSLETEIAKLGVPYRIQFPYYLWGVRFFPDFLLPTLKIIMEVDDDSHRRAEKQEADASRTAELNALGWTVVRCTNQEALTAPRETVRRLLSEAGNKYPPVERCTLERGLPKKIAKKGKMTRGTLRSIRRGSAEASSAPPLPN